MFAGQTQGHDGVVDLGPAGQLGGRLLDPQGLVLGPLAGAEPRSRVVEFSEMNPAFDPDGRTARLAAAAIWHYLAAVASRPSRKKRQ